MASDTTYKPIPYVYIDHGLVARHVEDQCPPNTYLNNLNCLSRAENSMSSRFGTQIINRDPAGTGTSNYYFTQPVTSITRLNYQSNSWRYAGLSDGSLWRRAGNTQGAYTGLTLPTTVTGSQIVLSGQPFESFVDSCYETSQPFLFIYDQDASIKDQGTGSPQLTGIDPSPYTLNVLPYAPLLTMIDSFATGNSYTVVNVTGWAWSTYETIPVTSGNMITDFSQFISNTSTGSKLYPTPTSGSADAIRAIKGITIATSTANSGYTSTVPSLGTTVTIHLSIDGYIDITGSAASGTIDYQYSLDSGTTWQNFYSASSPVSTSIPTQNIPVIVIVGNIDTIQTRVQAIAGVTANGSAADVSGEILDVFVTIGNPYGTSMENSMISILNTNTTISVPVVSLTSSNLIGGLYTELTVTTQTPHGLSAGSMISIYASTNDLVDGFYKVIAAPTSTTFTIPFISATSIGASGGTVYGGAAAPAYCVISSQYNLPYPPQFSAFGFYQYVPPTTTTFPVSFWGGSVAANTVGTVTSAVSLDLNQNNQVTDDDLIVITINATEPTNIMQVSLLFYVGSGVSSYYQAFISPAYFQGAISGNATAYQTTENQILADTLGLITGQTVGTTAAQLQPSSLSTGSGTWQACYIPRGNFLPVGQAGQPGLDWSNVTGWQLNVTTNSNGACTFEVNGIYLQWGYGPSSFAGVGYDYRQTYYDANTGTESSPCPEQMFNKDFGYLASAVAPIFLRQAAQVVGQYSPDPQVTHVRQYRRGGTMADNWVQVGQIPNITGTGQFYFKDVIADAYIQQAQILVKDNDPPVTSNLVSPIETTLAASTILIGLNSIYSTFTPQTVTVAQTGAVFVQNQLAIIGNPSNEEVVAVISGGTGTFTAILRLQHNQGEPVSVYAVPRQACNLCAFAYDRVWLAGDPNNPHYLYYSKKGLPENFGPQNYIPVSTPDDPINAVINWRGTLIVGTLKSWFIIVGQGHSPYAQPTGSVHGIIAQNGWVEVEGAIAYRAADGIRMFTGAEGQYMTLPIEWIYRGNPQCIPPQADSTQATNDLMAYYNNQVFESYVSLNSGQRYRMIWDTEYKRFRYDDVAATAMYWERDTNVFLVGKKIGTGKYAVVQDQVGDYDDGGWNTATPPTLVQTPINITIQSPYRDLGKPHNQKQWNSYETDVNTQGQTMTSTLLFEDGTISVPLADAATSSRQKVELFVNNGLGQAAYRASIVHTIPVTVAPILYQEDIYAAELAELTATIDSYWIKFGIDESKFVKQAYFDYSSPVPLSGSLYADNSAIPYFTFTLPASTIRTVIRQRFGNNNSGTTAFTLRTWRIVVLATGSVPPETFQMWSPIKIDWKPIGQNSFRKYELQT